MSTTVATKTKMDLVEELYRVPEHGKAEIIGGKVISFMARGKRPSRASSRIWRSLDDYESSHGGGLAVNDNAGFIVDLPNRKSFSPDAAWHLGEIGDQETEMDFYDGAPVFAAEVRSKLDYGQYAERQIEEKRRDYFAAGTKVVWDVDLLGEDVVRVYRADNPDSPTVFRRGEIADAEPAVPGWRMPVDDLFR
ncbi:MAG: Uma2 family endonuclease [Acidobacteria bacterium]|nr:Uma2 family endonuclease [Acidobacteriota bacterium]